MGVYFHSMALDHALETADFERSTQVKTFKSMLPNTFDERSQASDCASGGLRRLRRRRKFAWAHAVQGVEKTELHTKPTYEGIY